MPKDYDLVKFFDLSLDMFCIAGTESFKKVNRAFERTLGWSERELLSRPFLDFIHPDDVEATLQEIEKLVSGIPTISFENRYRCGDGSYKHLQWGAFPEEETGLLFAVARDVTEIRKARERFRLAIEASPTAMVMVDHAGCIAMINEATEELFGYTRDELLGQGISLLVPERFRHEHHQNVEGFHSNPAKREMGTGRDLVARRQDGSEFPVEIGLNPIETEDGHFAIAAISDLTERKLAAAELARSHAELERSNEELQRFAYVASHDLQEPLRMVAGYTQLLARRYEDQLDAEAHSFIDYAVDGVKRMKQLIHDLLAYSRVGSQGRSFEPVELVEAVEWALANLEAAVEEAGAKIEYGDLPKVDGDRPQLGQLFQNLIGNALKFGDGQVPRIRIHARTTEEGWSIGVEDNGIGIEPRHREKIFEIFQRLQRREQVEGTGIGLAICSRIVERHGGRIWVESEPGEGSTFWFTLPRRQPTDSDDAADADDQTPASRGAEDGRETAAASAEAVS
jgi:PAS domain S-box-containing protein